MKKIAQLQYNPATNRLDFDGYGLHCGQCLEVLVVDIDGQAKWVETQLEYADDQWYLVGLWGGQANGLFARM